MSRVSSLVCSVGTTFGDVTKYIIDRNVKHDIQISTEARNEIVTFPDVALFLIH